MPSRREVKLYCTLHLHSLISHQGKSGRIDRQRMRGVCERGGYRIASARFRLMTILFLSVLGPQEEKGKRGMTYSATEVMTTLIKFVSIAVVKFVSTPPPKTAHQFLLFPRQQKEKEKTYKLLSSQRFYST